jgi:predicted lipoprotein with Yx(FWY)xxD motif
MDDHHRPMNRTLTLTAALAALVLAGCGGDDDDSSDGVAATTTTEAAKPAGSDGGAGGQPAKPDGSLVEVGDSEFGEILVDDEGRTLYAFDKEKTDRSECFGACAEAWPPFYTKGEPRAGEGVDQDLLGATDHEGRDLVTYDGHPLYYYVDEGPNEVLCQGVDEFGGLWLVVSPNGDPIR